MSIRGARASQVRTHSWQGREGGPGVVRRLLNLVCLWANVCVAACVCFCLCVSVLYNVCVSLSLSVCARLFVRGLLFVWSKGRWNVLIRRVCLRRNSSAPKLNPFCCICCRRQ